MAGLALHARQKWLTAAAAALLVTAMAVLGFKSAELYRIFCQATGYGGTTQRAEGATAPGAVAGKVITIRFDANHVPALPWNFAPEVVTQQVTIGAKNIAFFTAENLADVPITGRASYNVTPDLTGAYFTKIQCFCFSEQTLQPHQKVRMPVVFFVNPDILKDDNTRNIPEITLSYTFYPVDRPGKPG